MDQFSISQLAQFSGVKPHTIRIWEQRYNALKPQRSEGNTRFYDGLQLRRLLNIVSLSGTEYKISQLCAMTDDELFHLKERYYKEAIQDNDYGYFVSQLVSAGISFDELKFGRFFSHCLLRFGLTKTYKEILYPLLNRVGLMWSSNIIPPSQEHFISNVLRQKLFTAVDSLTTEDADEEKWLLFLPEDEFHEIGLLFANYYIRHAGQQVIYLGSNVPLDSLETTVSELDIDNILTFLVHKDLPENVETYLQALIKSTGKRKIYVGCSEEYAEDVQADITWLHSVEDLEEAVKRHKRAEWQR